jgi:hypothetical protein
MSDVKTQMRAVAASVALSGVLALALLSTSPPSCGCSAEEDFAGELVVAGGLRDALPGDLTPAAITVAVNQIYVGRQLGEFAAPAAMRKGDCVRSERALECVYLLASGPLREEQLRMRFVSDSQGKVERVETEEIRRWVWN